MLDLKIISGRTLIVMLHGCFIAAKNYYHLKKQVCNVFCLFKLCYIVSVD